MDIKLPALKPCSRILLSGFAAGHSGVAQTTTELKKLGITVNYFEDLSVPAALEFNPDVLIVYSTRRRFLAAAAPSIRAFKCPKALWHCDLRPPTALARYCRKVFDGVFLPWTGRFNDPTYGLGDCDVAAWRRALEARCWYMPQAAELREPPISDTARRRVVFIGDLDLPCHRGRRELCKAVGATVLNSKEKKERTAISKASRSLYASSDFSLSMSPPAPEYTSNRTYTILAWRGLLLLHHYPLCEKQFRSGEHALVFKSTKQVHRLIAGFSKDVRSAERVRKAGWTLAASKHTYAHRVLNIAANLLGESDTFWGYL